MRKGDERQVTYQPLPPGAKISRLVSEAETGKQAMSRRRACGGLKHGWTWSQSLQHLNTASEVRKSDGVNQVILPNHPNTLIT